MGKGVHTGDETSLCVESDLPIAYGYTVAISKNIVLNPKIIFVFISKIAFNKKKTTDNKVIFGRFEI